MGKPAGSFTVALGDELKAQLVAAARKARTSPSALARQAIAQTLAGRDVDDRRPPPAQAASEAMKEFRVTVPKSSAARLAAAARAAGMTRSAYVSTAALGVADGRGRGGRAPVRAPAAISSLREALMRSNAGLAPIGRNLNQVTRVLNAHPGRMSSSDKENLERVAEQVVEHLKVVSELLHAIHAPRIHNVR
jgi:predicted HicB family RNase H-like nuclease